MENLFRNREMGFYVELGAADSWLGLGIPPRKMSGPKIGKSLRLGCPLLGSAGMSQWLGSSELDMFSQYIPHVFFRR